AACPPNTVKSPTVTWPPSTTLLAKITSLPTLQSWPIWDPTISQQRSPTSVTPPSSSVPVFTVTPSRMSQSAPITSRVGPPRYLTDCGGGPSEADGESTGRGPIVGGPAAGTWAKSPQPSPPLTHPPPPHTVPLSHP